MHNQHWPTFNQDQHQDNAHQNKQAKRAYGSASKRIKGIIVKLYETFFLVLYVIYLHIHLMAMSWSYNIITVKPDVNAVNKTCDFCSSSLISVYFQIFSEVIQYQFKCSKHTYMGIGSMGFLEEKKSNIKCSLF